MYLIARGVIRARIPVAYIATVAVLTFLFPMGGNDRLTWMAYQLFTGGLFLGAFFMATDYVTSPVTKKGEVIFGIGCGLLTVFIRYFGGLPEGVSYSIILMNILTPLLERAIKPRAFGSQRAPKGKVRCTVCGAVLDEGTETCPVCGVSSDKFVPETAPAGRYVPCEDNGPAYQRAYELYRRLYGAVRPLYGSG